MLDIFNKIKASRAAKGTPGCFTSAHLPTSGPTCQKFHLSSWFPSEGTECLMWSTARHAAGRTIQRRLNSNQRKERSFLAFHARFHVFVARPHCDPALLRRHQSYLAPSRLLCSLRTWTCWHPAPPPPQQFIFLGRERRLASGAAFLNISRHLVVRRSILTEN